MQVQVTGKHVDMGEALRSRITDELQLAIGKYFERGGDADVVLTRDGHSFRVDCAVRLASGQRLDSHGMAADAHAAFDTALAKVVANGGKVVFPRTPVPGVVVVGLFTDPAGNRMGLVEMDGDKPRVPPAAK